MGHPARGRPSAPTCTHRAHTHTRDVRIYADRLVSGTKAYVSACTTPIIKPRTRAHTVAHPRTYVCPNTYVCGICGMRIGVVKAVSRRRNRENGTRGETDRWVAREGAGGDEFGVELSANEGTEAGGRG